MRTIKFRVWNSKTKSWIHGPHERSALDGVNLLGETILLGGFLDGVSIQDLNEIVPLQFTGLSDKNGNEIYEGDILRNFDEECSGEITPRKGKQVIRHFKVIYCSHEGRFKSQYLDWFHKHAGENTGNPVSGFITWRDSIVIGNIYDNPEWEIIFNDLSKVQC
jgi:hypothetical protein